MAALYLDGGPNGPQNWRPAALEMGVGLGKPSALAAPWLAFPAAAEFSVL